MSLVQDTELTETNTGLTGKPDLVLQLRLYKDQPWGDVQVKVVNTIGRTISVSMIRSVHATGGKSVHWMERSRPIVYSPIAIAKTGRL